MFANINFLFVIKVATGSSSFGFGLVWFGLGRVWVEFGSEF
jgi:hypothetical protein